MERPKRTFCSTIRIVVPASIIARTLSLMTARLAGSSRAWLVKQHHFRLKHEGAGELDHPPLSTGKRAAGTWAARRGSGTSALARRSGPRYAGAAS